MKIPFCRKLTDLQKSKLEWLGLKIFLWANLVFFVPFSIYIPIFLLYNPGDPLQLLSWLLLLIPAAGLSVLLSLLGMILGLILVSWQLLCLALLYIILCFIVYFSIDYADNWKIFLFLIVFTAILLIHLLTTAILFTKKKRGLLKKHSSTTYL
jgi:hypothetical protein